MKFIKNKLGFTLVELLAVMVILAIILAITVPIISGIISSSARGAFEIDAKMIIKAIDYKKMSDDTFDETSITESNIKTLLGISDNNYEVLQISLQSGKPYILILGKNKWEGYKACGTITNMQVVNDDNEEVCFIPIYTDYSTTEGVNKPRLADGMTAIKWDGTTSDWVKVENYEEDTSWYDYANKEWANAVTNDCTTPGDYDTCSMWVWIPRYAYKITTCYHLNTTDCNTTTGKNAGEIDVKFLIDDTNTTSDATPIAEAPEYSGSSQTNFIKHPAFTFDGIELTGIWVAKFETSGTTDSLDFKPGVASIAGGTIDDKFMASRNMEINDKYGWDEASGLNDNWTFANDTNGIDTHMMKNIEWGAVAYLSQSTYGKNAEITRNGTLYTGGGIGDAYITNVGQSTTGNIYGIYDMSGGAHDCVAAYDTHWYASAYAIEIMAADDKYTDEYANVGSKEENFLASATKYGDAVYETSTGYDYNSLNSWYNDESNMPYSAAWFTRGGYYNKTSAGIFNFSDHDGDSYGGDSFRVTLLVGEGL